MITDTETYEEFLARLHRRNAVRRRYYAIGRLRKSDFKKMEKWVHSKDRIEIAIDLDGQVYLFNDTKMENAPTGLFH